MMDLWRKTLSIGCLDRLAKTAAVIRCCPAFRLIHSSSLYVRPSLSLDVDLEWTVIVIVGRPHPQTTVSGSRQCGLDERPTGEDLFTTWSRDRSPFRDERGIRESSQAQTSFQDCKS